MTENSGNKRKAPGKNDSESREEVIELSDIAVGISPEDEEIIDLTEEIVVGAIEGFSGASGRTDDDVEILDLSRMETTEEAGDSFENIETGEDEVLLDSLNATADFREDIEHKLDNYFQTDEEAGERSAAESEIDSVAEADQTAAEPDIGPVSARQLEEALERVIRKMFAEKIDRMLDDMIESSLSREIDAIKELLSKRK